MRVKKWTEDCKKTLFLISLCIGDLVKVSDRNYEFGNRLTTTQGNN